MIIWYVWSSFHGIGYISTQDCKTTIRFQCHQNGQLRFSRNQLRSITWYVYLNDVCIHIARWFNRWIQLYRCSCRWAVTLCIGETNTISMCIYGIKWILGHRKDCWHHYGYRKFMNRSLHPLAITLKYELIFARLFPATARKLTSAWVWCRSHVAKSYHLFSCR